MFGSEFTYPRGFPPNNDFCALAVLLMEFAIRQPPRPRPQWKHNCNHRGMLMPQKARSFRLTSQLRRAERSLSFYSNDKMALPAGTSVAIPVSCSNGYTYLESCLTRLAPTASPMTCRPGFSCTVGNTWGEFGCCNKVECDASYYEACVDPVNNRCLVGGMDFGAGCDIYSKVLTW